MIGNVALRQLGLATGALFLPRKPCPIYNPDDVLFFPEAALGAAVIESSSGLKDLAGESY